MCAWGGIIERLVEWSDFHTTLPDAFLLDHLSLRAVREEQQEWCQFPKTACIQIVRQYIKREKIFITNSYLILFFKIIVSQASEQKKQALITF